MERVWGRRFRSIGRLFILSGVRFWRYGFKVFESFLRFWEKAVFERERMRWAVSFGRNSLDDFL